MNFYNIFYNPNLEYNHLLVNIIKKVSYLIFAKKGEIKIFDHKNNIILKTT